MTIFYYCRTKKLIFGRPVLWKEQVQVYSIIGARSGKAILGRMFFFSPKDFTEQFGFRPTGRFYCGSKLIETRKYFK